MKINFKRDLKIGSNLTDKEDFELPIGKDKFDR